MVINPSEEDVMHKDSKNWKLGVFYYNPLDERLMVPKKNHSIGATMNFANPRAYWIFFPAVILILLTIIVLIAKL